MFLWAETGANCFQVKMSAKGQDLKAGIRHYGVPQHLMISGRRTFLQVLLAFYCPPQYPAPAACGGLSTANTHVSSEANTSVVAPCAQALHTHPGPQPCPVPTTEVA